MPDNAQQYSNSTAYQNFSGNLQNSDPLSRAVFLTARSMADMSECPQLTHDDLQTQAQEIQGLLENIRPDVEIPKEDREGTPEGLKYALYEHQKLALTWLKSMEEGTSKGGILADDMGLGKTISTLALILSRPSDDRARKTTLIIGPVALVRQWAREVETKIKRSHSLSTYLYHTGKKVTWDTLRSYDVVLTTYGKLGAEHKRKEEWEGKLKANPDMDQSGVQFMFPLLSDSSKWYRVILDEAQFIKNKGTRAARGACELKSMTRFCLTGTPMMNGVYELYSLIRFLRIKPYNEYHKFTRDFAVLSRSPTPGSHYGRRDQENAMKRLQAVLKAVLLRRTKKSKIDGQPILTLPEKTEEIVHAVFNEDEQAYYTALESRTRLTFNKYLKAGTIGKNYSNILVLLLRLRQAACHPHLIMDFEETPAEGQVADMEIWAKTLHPDVIRRILSAPFPFECPVCYDPVPNPRFVTPCGHETCSECLVRITTNGMEEGIRGGVEAQNTKCPTCRGWIDLKKVIDYKTFMKVHDPESTRKASSGKGDSPSEEDSDTEETDTDSEMPGEDIRDFIVPDNYESSDESGQDDDSDADFKVNEKSKPSIPNLRVRRERDAREVVKEDVDMDAEEEFKAEETDDDDDDGFIEIKNMKRPGFAPPKRMERKSEKPKGSERHRSKSKGRAKGKYSSIKRSSLAQLKREAMRSVEGRRRYMRYLRKNWVSSAKVDKCLEILRDTDPSTKTIIFSQFTTLLDFLEIPIRGEKWGYGRYDGCMTADARHRAVVKFTDDPNCKIMLVSLKAGNAGLNLVAASQVIILDPFW
jgi:SNF2 family DNA or RNA helicase